MNTVRHTISLLLAAVLIIGISVTGFAVPAVPTEQPVGTAEPTAWISDERELTQSELEAITDGEALLEFSDELDLPSAGSIAALSVQAKLPTARARIGEAGYELEYYHSQLPEVSQKIYEAIRNSNLWNGPTTEPIELVNVIPSAYLTVTGQVTATKDNRGDCTVSGTIDNSAAEELSNIIFAASTALLYDHPELSWLVNTRPNMSNRYSVEPSAEDNILLQSLRPGESCVLPTSTIHITSLTYGLTEEGVQQATLSPEQVPSGNPYEYANTGDRVQIEAAVAAAKREIGSLTQQSDSEKIRALHNWLCRHTDYADKNSPEFENGWRGYQTAYSALVEGVTVCAGYAKTLKLLCDEYGVPCVIVCGKSHNEDHAWNYVRIDGEWYGVDATWADGEDGHIYDNDYLKGETTFGEDHLAQSLCPYYEFEYPALSETDYNGQALQTPQLILRAQKDGSNLAPGSILARGDEVTFTITGTSLSAITEMRGRIELQGMDFISGSRAEANMFAFQPSENENESMLTCRVSGTGTISLTASSIICRTGSRTITLPDQSWSGAVETAAAKPKLQMEVNGTAMPGGILSVILSASDAGPDVQQIRCTLTAAGAVPAEQAVTLTRDGEFFMGSAVLTVPASVQTGAEISAQVTQATVETASGALHLEELPSVWKASVLTASSANLTMTVRGTNGGALTDGSELRAGDSITVILSASGLPAGQNASCTMAFTGLGIDGQLMNGAEIHSVPYGEAVAVPLEVIEGSSTVSVQIKNIDPEGTICIPNLWHGKIVPAGPIPSVSPEPAPDLPQIDGYQAGLVNGRVYYVKTVDASTLYYLKSSSGRLVRVLAPSIPDSDGVNYYPVNHSGTVLYPHSDNGSVSCFSRFENSMEIPVLAVMANPEPRLDENGYQSCQMNGRTYFVKVSGVSMMYYLKSSSGRLVRVIAPYVTDRNGTRYYPVNYGGMVLVPQLQDGILTSYGTELQVIVF